MLNVAAASSVSQSDNSSVYLAMFLSAVGLVMIVVSVIFVVLRRRRLCLRGTSNLPPLSVTTDEQRYGVISLNKGFTHLEAEMVVGI